MTDSVRDFEGTASPLLSSLVTYLRGACNKRLFSPVLDLAQRITPQRWWCAPSPFLTSFFPTLERLLISRTFDDPPDMNVNAVAYAHSVLASSIVRPPCSGCSKILVPTSWHSQRRAFFPVLFLALVASPAFVSAAPGLTPGVHINIDGIYQRDQNSTPPSNTDTSQSSDNGSISMNVWVRGAVVGVKWTLCSSLSSVSAMIASDSHRHRGIHSLLGRYVRPSVCGL